MTRLIAAVTVAALIGIAVVAPDFIVVRSRREVAAAIQLLQVLVWVGLIHVAALRMSLLLRRSVMRGCFPLHGCFVALSAVGFAIGLHWGIVGVAAGYAIAK